jgi:hypothetical protein
MLNLYQTLVQLLGFTFRFNINTKNSYLINLRGQSVVNELALVLEGEGLLLQADDFAARRMNLGSAESA